VWSVPKNLYHFDAPVYDQDGLAEMALAAKYIPLKQKVRNMFDIGSGGGSLGVLLKAKYDIQTISSAFADWPYCEYITERGNLCLLIDVMEAMPFAKFSFDMVHISYVSSPTAHVDSEWLSSGRGSELPHTLICVSIIALDHLVCRWVYHGQTPTELWNFVHEVDRILRPGGYIYMRGGQSSSTRAHSPRSATTRS
jgi:hypothetical protein